MAKRAFPEPEDLLASYFEAELAEEVAACPPRPASASPAPRGGAADRRAPDRRVGAARGRNVHSGRALELGAAAAIAFSIGAMAWAAEGTGAAAGLMARSIESEYAARAGEAVRDVFLSAFAAFARRASGDVRGDPGAWKPGPRWKASD